MEGLVDIYYKKLQEEQNPGLILTRFYCELFGLPFAPSLIAKLNKLIKLYGKQALFFAILDISNNDNIDHTTSYGLLAYICKKRFEHSINTNTKDLSSIVDLQADKIEKLKKETIEIRSPFDE
jgi:hypothetical protein